MQWARKIGTINPCLLPYEGSVRVMAVCGKNLVFACSGWLWKEEGPQLAVSGAVQPCSAR